MSWQEDLFTHLWEELDFDDHPVDMGHSSQPVGQVRMRLIDGCLRLRDERIAFNIVGCPDDVPEQEESILHLLSTHPRVASPAPGRKGLHRWTIGIDMLPESVLESNQMKALLEVSNWDSLLPEDEGAPNIDWPQDLTLSTVHHKPFDWHKAFDEWPGPASQVAAYRYLLSHLMVGHGHLRLITKPIDAVGTCGCLMNYTHFSLFSSALAGSPMTMIYREGFYSLKEPQKGRLIGKVRLLKTSMTLNEPR
jgi:hypothetical protein